MAAYFDCFREILHLIFFYLANLLFVHVFKMSKFLKASSKFLKKSLQHNPATGLKMWYSQSCYVFLGILDSTPDTSNKNT